MPKSIKDRLIDIIIENMGCKPEEITDDAKFVEDLGCDSLDTVELVMAAEDEFGIEIEDEAAEKCTTVGEAVTFLEGRMS